MTERELQDMEQIASGDCDMVLQRACDEVRRLKLDSRRLDALESFVRSGGVLIFDSANMTVRKALDNLLDLGV